MTLLLQHIGIGVEYLSEAAGRYKAALSAVHGLEAALQRGEEFLGA